jgi:outer membrane lipopolysaccharide assembly protein LptE/RlpB
MRVRDDHSSSLSRELTIHLDSMRRFGVLIGSLLIGLTGCFYHFSGGGLPPNVHTIAIVTFENQTPSPDIPKELYEQMRRELLRRLSVRDAPQDRADALVHGVIQSYDADVPVSFSSIPQQAVSAQRRLQLTIDVEILDQSNGHVIYANKALRAEADYAERSEPEGRTRAIEKLVQSIVEGVQSHW